MRGNCGSLRAGGLGLGCELVFDSIHRFESEAQRVNGIVVWGVVIVM